jgi:hypothetical protein
MRTGPPNSLSREARASSPRVFASRGKIKTGRRYENAPRGVDCRGLQVPSSGSQRLPVAQGCSYQKRGPHTRPTAVLIANPRLDPRPTSRKQTAAVASNSEFLHIFISSTRPPTAHCFSLDIAFLFDRAYQLEMHVNPCKQRSAAHSNRRWITVSKIPLCKLRPCLRSKDDAIKEASL